VSRVALVTGATRGIGAVIARRLTEEGFSLTVAARDAERLEKISAELGTAGAEVHPVTANMAHEDQVLELARSHRDRFGRLDVLVLNAGVGAKEPIGAQDMRRYDKLFAVNTRAPMLLMRELLPVLRDTAKQVPARGAKIIAVSSITGVVAEPQMAAYGASKAALVSLCEALNVEESAAGVTATAIAPGFVDTDMTDWLKDTLSASDMLTGDDVAEMVLAITRLSARAVVPSIVLTRGGEQLWRA
jgi:3-oxoacyl-[acyl-carrier protein] reductase